MNCPDCGAEIKEVTVEKFLTKTFKVDEENKKLVPVYPQIPWDEDDHCFHCSNCDSLNIDEMLRDYHLEEGGDK